MVVVGTSELQTLWQAAVYIESPHNVSYVMWAMVVVGTSELRTLWQAVVYIESPHNVRLRNVSYGCGGYLRVTDAVAGSCLHWIPS